MKRFLIFAVALAGCSRAKPHAHLIAPPQCVRVLSPVKLTDDGKRLDPHGHFDMAITCTQVQR